MCLGRTNVVEIKFTTAFKINKFTNVFSEVRIYTAERMEQRVVTETAQVSKRQFEYLAATIYDQMKINCHGRPNW